MGSKDAFSCLVCRDGGLRVVPDFSRLPRVTSDCRQFPPGGDLAQCIECGAIQKLPSERWLAEIHKIYRDYEPYHQAEGEEQLSLDPGTGSLRRRSDILVHRLIEQIKLPEDGALLDVGCGTGVTLRAFSKHRPLWRLEGYELSASNLDKLRDLRGFHKLHTGPIHDIRSQYQLVTMIHSLEHFINPAAALDGVRPLLAKGGLLFIEVCNIEQNPFDILVADHLMHFSPTTLGMLLRRSGLDPFGIATDWIGKEISAAAKIATTVASGQHAEDRSMHGWAQLEKTILWLEHFVANARAAAARSPHFGIFGTSISGVWLASQLGDSVAFFVDEDRSRIGRTLLGRPIISSREVSPQATVFLALIPPTAHLVKSRFLDHPATWLLPPGGPS